MEKEKLVQEITYIAMLVDAHTDRCVFTRYWGHVNGLDIDICESKNDYNNKICSSNISLNSDCALEELQEAKTTLLGFLENGKVDITGLAYEVEEVRHYKF